MTIEERFEMLEAELAASRSLTRRLMFGAGIFLGMFVLFVTVRAITGVANGQVNITGKVRELAKGQEKETVSRVIRANSFIMEDRQGRQRAMLAMTSDRVGLDIFDQWGTSRIQINMGVNGPDLIVADENGTPRIRLGIVGDRPSLALFDTNRVFRVDLGMSGGGGVIGGGPSLTLADEKGAVLWQAP